MLAMLWKKSKRAMEPNAQRLAKFVHSLPGYKSPVPIPETQSVFHPHAQRNAFRCRGARQQSRLFAPANPKLETQPQLQPALLRLSAITSRVPKCDERILESRTSRPHRKFTYPVIAAVTAPALIFA